jgi:tetratricopeptide (TPR) repeat protein
MAQSTALADTLAARLAEGLAAHQAGRLADAERRYDAVLAEAPGHFDALHLSGVLMVQTGRPGAAAERLQRAARADPGAAAPLVNLAAALNQLGRHDAAIASAARALALEPLNAGAHSNQGSALLALGRPGEALASYDRALSIDPTSADGWYNRANALRDLSRADEALAAYDRAIALRPGYLEALNNRAAVLSALDRHEAALASYDAALAAWPGSAATHANRAKTLNDLKRADEALAAAERALALKPDDAEAHNHRGVALLELRRPVEALAACERALALRPGYAEAHNNIGIILYDLRRPADAVAAFDQALALRPAFPVARFNRATALLAAGDLKRGFQAFYSRWDSLGGDGPVPRLPGLLWEGEDLAGKSILVLSEQGFGDTLQFVRYVPRLVEAGARVTVLTNPPLVTLLRSIPGIEVTGALPADAMYDFQVAMMCLPRVFGTTLETIPGETPYLAADLAKAGRWAARLAALGDGPKVGLVWAGASRKHDLGAFALDRRRSLALDQLAPLADVPGVGFVSLQKDEPALQARHPPAGLRLVDFATELGDFADTAAVVAGLDLVISVDTSVAHLTGALGKPVWILSRYEGCWRWLNGREDTPWYPTARLYHQRAPGDWAEVIARVAGDFGRLR